MSKAKFLPGKISHHPISRTDTQLMLEQMAHFWFNSRCEAAESGQNRRLRPQKPLLEQIRPSASSTGAGSRAVREECAHISTPFTPNARATNCRQRRLLELVFIRKSTLIFFPPCSLSCQRPLLTAYLSFKTAAPLSLTSVTFSPVPTVRYQKGSYFLGLKFPSVFGFMCVLSACSCCETCL